MDEGDTALWTISENLHRAELSQEERGRLVKQWADRTGDKLTQIGSVSGGHGKEGGIRKAARELGIPFSTAQRSVQAANRADGIAPPARPVAPPREPHNDFEVIDKQVDAIMRAWNAAGREARERFLEMVDDCDPELRAAIGLQAHTENPSEKPPRRLRKSVTLSTPAKPYIKQ